MIFWISVGIVVMALYFYHCDHLPFSPTGSDVLLVIAHPDDEAMFFGPTLRALVKKEITVHVLCLSNGNADGLGKIREKELKASLKTLGISNHFIVNDEYFTLLIYRNLQDGFHLWDPAIIAKHIESYLGKYSCHTILTFDDYGVSGHPNHKSIYTGLNSFLNSNPNLDGWSLVSTSIFRKFTFFLDIIPSAMSQNPLVLSSIQDYFSIRSAMTNHKSQLVWFRMFYIVFSRYMYLNDWKRIK